MSVLSLGDFKIKSIKPTLKTGDDLVQTLKKKNSVKWKKAHVIVKLKANLVFI